MYREDCTQCFDSIDDPAGLDVCLSCFNGGCAGDRKHNVLHYQNTGHPLALNIKRTRKHIQRDEPPVKMTKLAIAAETEEDKYDTKSHVVCHECQSDDVGTLGGKVADVVAGILRASTFAQQQEVKAWEEEFTPCEHTLCLEQQPARQIASQDLGHCSMCDLKENLWLCLECGNLGCGRKQYGSILPGNGHGVAHVESSGHGVAVKLGSITADGSADVYCYKCNEERIDTELAAHLAHWGIKIAEQEKTEKSLMEMNVEQNLKWDFSMVTDDGKELTPLFGQGFTGLKNIGNTCYLASTVQCLFALPEFQQRYFLPGQPPPQAALPAEDLETQLRKLADGILSGRYSKPETDVHAKPDNPEVPHQNGLSPAMFKYLVGRGHSEFATMRQQDAFEFLLHLFKLINVSNSSTPAQDPVQSFRFALEQRLQCTSCKKVRYRVDEQDNISIPVPIRRIPGTASDSGDEKKEEFESVSLKECLDIFTATDMVELTCPACGSKDGFLKSSKFKTFPRNLAVNARRFELVNWVPTKLDVPVQVGDEPFDMSSYLSTGLAAGEEELPDEGDVSTAGANVFVPNEAAIGQLEAMGFPRVRCEKALHATGNEDAEAAMNWLFSHMEDPDIDEPVNLGGNAAAETDDADKIAQLGDMGISAPQARKALRECGGDVNRALDWVFSHPDDQGDFGEDVPTETAAPKSLPGSSETPAIFELDSIACHKGSSIHAGHYVAFIRKEIPGETKGRKWVLFNDEKVVQTEEIEEMKKFAYVYFFRRS